MFYVEDDRENRTHFIGEPSTLTIKITEKLENQLIDSCDSKIIFKKSKKIFLILSKEMGYAIILSVLL